MADCNDTLRELEAFLDNELSGDTLHAIRAHLDGCMDCLQAFDFHAELKIVVAKKCRSDEMPPGLLAKIANCFGDDYLTESSTALDAVDADANLDITDGPSD